MSQLTRHNINFEYIQENFNYDKFDWSKEPIESFQELCKLRAQQLRDSYDYIILYHSGGSDSTTVLNSFLRNKIPLDEIITVSFNGINYPCVSGIKARLDLINNNFCGVFNRIELSIIDILNILRNDKILSDTPNFTGLLHSCARFNVEFFEKNNITISMNRKGKTCHLYGETDPWVIKKKDGYYAKFNVRQKFNPSNYYKNTLFFTDKQFPKLHIKQCYINARLLQTNPDISYIEVKKAIRDEYNSLISPIKSVSRPEWVLDNPACYSEVNVILNQYIKIHKEFLDIYKNSILNESIKINKFINMVSSEFSKEYKLLELGS